MNEPQEKKPLRLDKHVDHLRATHLGLLALCFVLLSAWALSRETEVKRAVNQLREINNVVQNWNPKWLDAYANTLIAQTRPSTLEPPLEKCSIPADGDRNATQIELRGPNWTVQPVPRALEGFQQSTSGGPGFSRNYLTAAPKFDQPQSLAKFAELWDALQINIPIYVPASASGKVVVANPDLTAKVFELSCGDGNAEAGSRKVQLELRSVAGAEEIKFLSNIAEAEVTHAYFDFQSARIAIPVKTNKLQQFDGQSSLKRLYGVNWDLGPFTRTFPDLSKVTQNYRALSFNQLFPVLEAEASRSEDRIEIFGAKIPTPEISRLGVLVILIVQLYFLLNLQAFSSLIHSDSEAIDAPWVGMYPSKWAKAATTISAFLFPSTVLAILCIYQIRLAGNRWTSGYALVAMVLSMLVSGFSFVIVRRIWKSVPTSMQDTN